MAMPAHLRAHQALAKARQAAVNATTRDVRAALGKATLADVRSVHSTIVGGRACVTVQAARWHDVNAVFRVIETVPGLVDFAIAGSIIRAYRPIDNEE